MNAPTRRFRLLHRERRARARRSHPGHPERRRPRGPGPRGTGCRLRPAGGAGGGRDLPVCLPDHRRPGRGARSLPGDARSGLGEPRPPARRVEVPRLGPPHRAEPLPRPVPDRRGAGRPSAVGRREPRGATARPRDGTISAARAGPWIGSARRARWRGRWRGFPRSSGWRFSCGSARGSPPRRSRKSPGCRRAPFARGSSTGCAPCEGCCTHERSIKTDRLRPTLGTNGWSRFSTASCRRRRRTRFASRSTAIRVCDATGRRSGPPGRRSLRSPPWNRSGERRGMRWTPHRRRPAPDAGGLTTDRRPSVSRLRGAGTGSRRLLTGSAWGVAAAALLLLALGLARFRVERVDHGFAFTVGGGPRDRRRPGRAQVPGGPGRRERPVRRCRRPGWHRRRRGHRHPRSTSYVTREELRQIARGSYPLTPGKPITCSSKTA